MKWMYEQVKTWGKQTSYTWNDNLDKCKNCNYQYSTWWWYVRKHQQFIAIYLTWLWWLKKIAGNEMQYGDTS